MDGPHESHKSENDNDSTNESNESPHGVNVVSKVTKSQMVYTTAPGAVAWGNPRQPREQLLTKLKTIRMEG